MRAAVLKARGRFEIEPRVSRSRSLANRSETSLLFSGICGSDLHEFVAGPLMAPMPSVLGHEFCAEVVEVGADVRGFEIGDRTVGVIYPSCGRCEFCKRGDFTLCDMRELAVGERNGSFAQFIARPRGRCSWFRHRHPLRKPR